MNAILSLIKNARYLNWKCFLFIEVNKLANALDKVTNEKVDVDDIQPILSGLGVYFPEEESQEMLSSVSVDSKYFFSKRVIIYKTCVYFHS